MEDIKKQVENWIKNGYDYNEGLALLTKYSTSRSLIKHLNRGTATESKLEHIKYHLLKEAGIKENEVIEDDSDLTIDHNVHGDQNTVLEEDIEQNKEGKPYSDEVKTLKRLKHKFYVDRAIEHKKYDEVGTSNDEESKAKRREIKAKIESLTLDIIVTDKKIVDLLNGKVAEDKSAIGELINKIFSKDIPLPKPGDELSANEVIALKKAHDNIVSSISKKKGKHKAAPSGPKKDKLETELNLLIERKQKIDEILKAIK